MRGFLNLLAKANLVELSDEEKLEAGLTAEVDKPLPVEAVTPTVQPPPPMPDPDFDLSPPSGATDAQRSFEDIYAAANIPPSAFPAEKLLKLLDGLKALDATTRKAAVTAMDAADDNWQISDSTSDAELKIAALDSYKQYLAERVGTLEKQAIAKTEEIRLSLENTISEIRKQISELEQLLEREITKSAQQTTSVEASVRNEREITGKETRRVDGEIERLNEILVQFSG